MERRRFLAGALTCCGVLPASRTDLTPSIRDFGAVGDGLHDDTTAFELATAHLLSKGGRIRLSVGVYRILGGWYLVPSDKETSDPRLLNP